MAVHTVYPEKYQTLLDEKVEAVKQQFSTFTCPEIAVYTSPVKHFRQRAEFKIWHQDNRAHYAMFEKGQLKKPYIIDEYLMGSKVICSLMPKLLDEINQCQQLRRKLFQAEFLTTLSGEALISLIYHKPLDDDWHSAARQLKQQLGVDIIGRSRKQKAVLDRDYVIELLTVEDKQYTYQQVENSFTQPNGVVCEKMLLWAKNSIEPTNRDMLELYCGNGNFTIALADRFRQVLATEISKTSVKSANFNIQKNNIGNIQVVRMSSEDFSQAMNGVRPFRRLKDIDLDSYDFSTVLVDPPRAGLDDETVKIVQQFDNILYISCNPNTLYENMQTLSQTHNIERFAVFDQFPYTDHLECGIFLQRKQ